MINLANFGKENQFKFIIEANWWRNWLSYVKTENETFYPGEMNNSTLIDQNSNLKRILLKENLLEHHDYEAVPKNVFRYLKKWYGIDIEIVRLLKIDPLENRIYL